MKIVCHYIEKLIIGVQVRAFDAPSGGGQKFWNGIVDEVRMWAVRKSRDS